MDTKQNLPMVELLSGPIVRKNSLRTNHACTLCDFYGHYSHHCQDLSEFRMALFNLRQHSLESDITLIEEVHPHLLLQTPCPFTWCPVLQTLLSPPSPTVHQTCLFCCFPSHNCNLSCNLNLNYQGNIGVHSHSTWSFSFTFSFYFSHHLGSWLSLPWYPTFYRISH